MDNNKNLFYEQAVPLTLTVVVLAALVALLFLVVWGLNLLPLADKIALNFRWTDILVGAIVYFKTAVDFAILMGRLMHQNPGWKKRIALEIGTAFGNALGTVLILALWVIFKELRFILAIMILLAALALFELAYAGLEHFAAWQEQRGIKRALYELMDKVLSAITYYVRPITSKIIPNFREKVGGGAALPWKSLLLFSFTVPFVLGLDNFAGYVPLFSLVNVFGFGIGVLAAHTLLNITLFLSPRKTVALVRNEWVSFLGALAFLILALWGLVEVARIFIH